eukprot:CAMPEP_0182549776 /NCGR_PEP_ID=MMETSP1323-20130603/40659_1 /TAXON_ID=236787 /ORGANISM="Florenciella parvula, Strain RCC1693" /LENGTH=487 /DNA_ID=CAMNT_0024761269 /DNA_START=27 /DNA_END=1486 /DNA_ORIENTATION=-
MRKYRLVAKKGEGTFSEVLKAQNVKDGKYHAIKCMKNHFDSIDQVNNLREIQALRRLSPHQHIIALEEVLYDQPTGRLALVFELMDANLYELIRGRRHYLNANLIRSYMFQLVRALHHMHRKGIFHRDIKPENILIENTSEMGRGLKLADFGSCRGIYSKQPYTEYISTRWYRAPECLLTDGYYGPEMDLWGAGCVFFEITSLYPLFPGTNELDQINRIHKVLGTPTPDLLAKFKRNGAAHVNFDFPDQKGIGLSQLIPHAAPECVDLMQKMLAYDAAERMSAREGLQHAYFRDVRELEARRQQQGGGASEDAGGASNASTSKSGRSTKRGESMEASGGGGAAGAQKALPNISPGMDASGNPTKAPAVPAASQPQGKSGASKAVKSNNASMSKSYGGGGAGSHAHASSGSYSNAQNAEAEASLPPIGAMGGSSTNKQNMQAAYNVSGGSKAKGVDKTSTKKKKRNNRNGAGGYGAQQGGGGYGAQGG